MLPLVKKLPFERIFFYGIAVSGQVAQSGFHFFLSIILIKVLSPAEFGLYAFIFILLFLTTGLGNALVNTPLSVYLQQDDSIDKQANLLHMFAKINLCLSIIAGTLLGGFIFLWQGKLWLALNTAMLTASFLWRHFSRGLNYARRNPTIATRSDIAYATFGITALLLILWQDSELLSLNLVLLILNASCIFSLFFASCDFVNLQFLQFRHGIFANYIPIWKESSRWSLLGVLTTEITANSHSYIISLLAGPVAFAPIAASVILFRPLNVIITSLTSLERPLLAKQFMANDARGARKTCLIFIGVLLTCWLFIVLGIWLIWPWLSDKLFVEKYDLRTIELAIFIWSAVFFIRICRTLPSLIMQAARKFKPLALTTAITSPISIIAVIVLFVLQGPLLSLGGILIGETCFLTLLSYKLWRKK